MSKCASQHWHNVIRASKPPTTNSWPTCSLIPFPPLHRILLSYVYYSAEYSYYGRTNQQWQTQWRFWICRTHIYTRCVSICVQLILGHHLQLVNSIIYLMTRSDKIIGLTLVREISKPWISQALSIPPMRNYSQWLYGQLLPRIRKTLQIIRWFRGPQRRWPYVHQLLWTATWNRWSLSVCWCSFGFMLILPTGSFSTSSERTTRCILHNILSWHYIWWVIQSILTLFYFIWCQLLSLTTCMCSQPRCLRS